MKKITLMSLVLLASIIAMGQQSFYDFTVKDITGNDFKLSSLKGNKVLVVNTASKCGLTPQFKQLQSVFETYGGDEFTIIGFPANNFGKQEPGTDTTNFGTGRLADHLPQPAGADDLDIVVDEPDYPSLRMADAEIADGRKIEGKIPSQDPDPRLFLLDLPEPLQDLRAGTPVVKDQDLVIGIDGFFQDAPDAVFNQLQLVPGRNQQAYQGRRVRKRVAHPEGFRVKTRFNENPGRARR